jgi:hypothetical protein
MQRRCVLATTVLLLLLTQRLPAPIVEPESTPPPVEAKKSVQPARPATKAPKSGGNELDRFIGTWVHETSRPLDFTKSPPAAPSTQRATITIKETSALFEIEYRGRLAEGYNVFSDIPEPYNKVREDYIKRLVT